MILLTLMAKENSNSIQFITHCIETFCQLLGQSINKIKSKIITTSKCSPDIISTLTTIFGMNHTKKFGKYFGFLYLIILLDPEFLVYLG